MPVPRRESCSQIPPCEQHPQECGGQTCFLHRWAELCWAGSEYAGPWLGLSCPRNHPKGGMEEPAHAMKKPTQGMEEQSQGMEEHVQGIKEPAHGMDEPA